MDNKNKKPKIPHCWYSYKITESEAKSLPLTHRYTDKK